MVVAKMKYTDTFLLDWLEAMVDEGACPGLINDDNGHWCVSFEGTQNVPLAEEPQDIWTSFFVEEGKWKPSIREAIIAAIEEQDE
jgi:hypothetical protein